MTIHALLVDFRVLVLLFVGLRVLLLMAYPPVGTQSEAGLSLGGDRAYHYQLARLSASGDLPFRDWWSEFPPIWSWLGVAVFRGLNNAPFTVWTAVMSGIMLAFDIGNLWLIRGIGARIYGRPTGVAVAWCYALLALPVIQLYWHFETMVTFWLLLGLYALLTRQDTLAGAAAAIGALVILTPIQVTATKFVLEHALFTAFTVVGVSLVGAWFARHLFPPVLSAKPRRLGPADL